MKDVAAVACVNKASDHGHHRPRNSFRRTTDLEFVRGRGDARRLPVQPRVVDPVLGLGDLARGDVSGFVERALGRPREAAGHSRAAVGEAPPPPMVSVFADAEDPTSPEPTRAIAAMPIRVVRWNLVEVFMVLVPSGWLDHHRPAAGGAVDASGRNWTAQTPWTAAGGRGDAGARAARRATGGRMGALPRPDVAPGPQRDLVDALHDLHHRAGWPSLRVLAREAGCSPTTVSAVFSSPRLPSWGVLELLVEAMDGDVGEFRRLWLAASTPDWRPTAPAAPLIAGRGAGAGRRPASPRGGRRAAAGHRRGRAWARPAW